MARRLKNVVAKLSLFFLLLCSGAIVRAQDATLNPLKVNTIDEFVSLIMKVVVSIGLPVVLFYIIWTGYYFVEARGNSTKLDKAKEMLTYTIIGAAVVIGAEVIHQALSGTIKQLGL